MSMHVHPIGYFKMLTLPWVHEIYKKILQIMPGKIKAKHCRDRIGRKFAIRSYKLVGIYILFDYWQCEITLVNELFVIVIALCNKLVLT